MEAEFSFVYLSWNQDGSLTVENMHSDASRIGVRRIASVQSCVCRDGLLNEETTGGNWTLLRHQADATSRGVEVYYLTTSKNVLPLWIQRLQKDSEVLPSHSANNIWYVIDTDLEQTTQAAPVQIFGVSAEKMWLNQSNRSRISL
jgi:hypothetical protein